MGNGISQSNLKRIAQVLSEERMSLQADKDHMLKSTIDSFLMFVSREIEDCSVYPYWSNLNFYDLDNFLFSLVYWNKSFACISSEDNIFIKEYIKKNRSRVWIYFSDQKLSEILIRSSGEKVLILIESVSKIISFLLQYATNSQSFHEELISLINLTLCDEFVIYFNKVWDDACCAIGNNVVGKKTPFFTKRWPRPDLLTEDNRRRILENWRDIKVGVIKLPEH